MNKIFELIPETSWHLLERYLLEMVSEIRQRREKRHITEVWGRKRTSLTVLKAAAARAADLPDDAAISAIRSSVPGTSEDQAKAHLDLARQKLKRERIKARDQQIASMTRDGYSNDEIARQTGVALSTAARKAAQFKGELR